MTLERKHWKNGWDVSGIRSRIKNKSWIHDSNVTLGTTRLYGKIELVARRHRAGNCSHKNLQICMGTHI
jgi:hypothetical protein